MLSPAGLINRPRLGAARHAAAGPSMLTVYSTGWDGPGLIESINDGTTGVDLSYWDLHFFLLIPTLWLVTVGKPTLLTVAPASPTHPRLVSFVRTSRRYPSATNTSHGSPEAKVRQTHQGLARRGAQRSLRREPGGHGSLLLPQSPRVSLEPTEKGGRGMVVSG